MAGLLSRYRSRRWRTSLNGAWMWSVARPLMSERKVRLSLVAWCRWYRHDLEGFSRSYPELTPDYAIEVDELVSLAEAYADGMVMSPERIDAEQKFWRVLEICRCGSHEHAIFRYFTKKLQPLACATANQVTFPVETAEWQRWCGPFREVFGNPFQPMTFDSAWRSDTALSIAKHIYENRDFSTMPILADALQDAGCDNADILSYCRDANQVHVRGCWVVDLVLGKS